ncbi:methionyl-tRNA formyltransferase, partial [bacterium]|nr:methionyl-tRNA formyltransferase [bacterium]
LQQVCEIGPEETAVELYERLSILGAKLLLKTLIGLQDGSVKRRPQDHSKATYAPKLTKKDGHIDWSKDPTTIINYVRGLTPWPGTYTYYTGRLLKIVKLKHASPPDDLSDAPAGTIVAASAKQGIVIKTNPGAVSIELLQPPGKRKMSARDFLTGHKMQPGGRLSPLADESFAAGEK